MSEPILVGIDPDHDVSVGIAACLRNCGNGVSDTRDVAPGLAVWNDRRPQASFIESELSEPSALATLRACLGFVAPWRVPVVSPPNSHRPPRRALVAGARTHIDKPFGIDRRATPVRVAISKPQAPAPGHVFLANPTRRGSIARMDATERNMHGPLKPVAESPATLAQTKGKASRGPKPGSPCVLIVDDDAEIRCGAQVRLQSAGYEVIVAGDGEQALHVVSQYHPDAILLDVRMPCMDGLTVLCKLRERPETADIPVIMLSASIMDRRAALDAGARFFMKKPYRARSLLAVVSTAIGHEQPFLDS